MKEEEIKIEEFLDITFPPKKILKKLEGSEYSELLTRYTYAAIFCICTLYEEKSVFEPGTIINDELVRKWARCAAKTKLSIPDEVYNKYLDSILNYISVTMCRICKKIEHSSSPLITLNMRLYNHLKN